MFPSSGNVLAACMPRLNRGVKTPQISSGLYATSSKPNYDLAYENLSNLKDCLRLSSHAMTCDLDYKFNFSNSNKKLDIKLFSKEYSDFYHRLIKFRKISNLDKFRVDNKVVISTANYIKTNINNIIHEQGEVITSNGLFSRKGSRCVNDDCPVDESNGEPYIGSNTTETDPDSPLGLKAIKFIESKVADSLVKSLQLPISVGFGLASTVLALCSSMYIAIKCKSMSNYLLFTPVIANFIALFNWFQVWFSVSKMQIKIQIDKVEKIMNFGFEIINSHLELDVSTTNQNTQETPTANALVMPDWVNLISHLFGFAIVGSMKLGFGWDFKKIKESLSLRREVLSLKTDICDVIKEFACDLGFTEILTESAQNKIYYQLQLDINELGTYHVVDFVTNPHRKLLLDNTIKEITKMLASNNSKGKELSVIRSSCSRALPELVKMQKLIREAMNGNERQATVGFALTGEHGIGKSYTARVIIRKVLRLCGYPTDIYNFDFGVNEQYFPQYLAQDGGLYNEFAAAIGESSSKIVTVINKIISGDSCNLEGADLHLKHQPCQLKLVGLTANHSKFVFNNQLHDEANKALLSRISTFKVEDPHYDANKGRDMQSHRQEDLSHLKFLYQKYNFKAGQTSAVISSAEQVEMTADEVVEKLARHVMENEISFLKTVKNSQLWSVEDEESIERLIQGAISRKDQIGVVHSNGQVSTLQQSNVLIYSVAGSACKGKTTFARKVGLHLADVFKLQFVEDPDLTTRFSTPRIVLLNDITFPRDFTAYVQFVDSLPEVSVLLLTANVKIKCQNYSLFSMNRFKRFLIQFEVRDLWNPFKLISDYTSYKCMYYLFPTDTLNVLNSTYDGMMRRLGIMNDVMLCQDSRLSCLARKRLIPGCYGDHGSIFTVDNGATFYHKGQPISRSAAFNMIVEAAKNYMARSKRLVAVDYAPPADFAPDVSIKIHNLQEFLQKASTRMGMGSLAMNQYPHIAQFNIVAEYREKFKVIIGEGSLTVPVIAPDTSESDLIEIVAYSLKQTDPTCKITVNCNHKRYIIDGGFVHTVDLRRNSSEDRPICHGKDGMIYWGQILISVSDYCLIRSNNPRWLAKFSRYGMYEDIRDTFIMRTNQIFRESPNTYKHYLDTWEALQKQRVRDMNTYEKLIGHPYFPLAAKIFSAVMGVIVVVCTVWLIKRKYLSSKKEKEEEERENKAQMEMHSSNSAEKYQRIGETMQKFLRQDHATDWETFAKGQGFSPEELISYDNWRHSNGVEKPLTPGVVKICDSLSQAIRSGNVVTTKVVFNELVKHTPITPQVLTQLLETPKANAVAVSDEISRNTGVIGEFAKKLKENLCSVHGDAGSCYGIFIRKNVLITVSHIFSSIKSQAKMVCTRTTRAGVKTRYDLPMKIMSINRDKDLAICRVEDASFPSMPDLSQYLISSVQTVDWSGTCYYVRPFTQVEVYGGSAMYSCKRVASRDPNNPNYMPKETFIFEATTFMNYPRHIYSPGDCGLPLLTLVSNEIRIVGIHNAFTNFGHAWFSPLPKEIFDMCETRFESNGVVEDKPVIGTDMNDVVRANVPNYMEFSIDDRKPHTRFPILNTKPEVFSDIGYVKDLTKHGNPKHSHVCNYMSGMKTQLSSGFSCVSPKYVPIDLVPEVPKTKEGLPEPALTQLMKFDNELVENIDEDIFKQAEEVRERFAECTYDTSLLKPLSLHASINGAPESTMNPIDLTTSPGLYLNKKFKMNDKERAFVKHVQPNGSHSFYTSNTPEGLQVRRDYHDILSCWEQGVPVRIVVADTKKVELLPLEKIRKDANVRLFNVLDTATNLALRSKFGMFYDQCVRNSSISHTVYGANPYKLYPWLIGEVQRRFKKVISSDVSRIDKNLSPRLIRSIIRYIGYLYTGDREDKCYKAIADSFIKCTHVFQGIVFETDSGNPSGCYLTVLFNTEARFIIDLYILCRMWRSIPNTITPFADIRKHTRTLITGDDEQIWFDPDFFELTDEILVQGYRDFGLRLTIDKNNDSSCPQFCSRFMLHDSNLGVIFPALKKSSIEKMLHYSLPQNEHLVDNVQMAVFEASFWEEEYFNKIKSDAILLLKSRGLINVTYLCEYHLQREHFAGYVRGFNDCPLLTERGAELLLRNRNIEMATSNVTISTESENWVSLYNIHHQRDPKEYPIPDITSSTRNPDNGEWFLTGRTPENTFTGAGPTKGAAKQQLYKQFVLSKFKDSPTANALAKSSRKHKHSLSYTISESEPGHGVSVTVMMDDKVVHMFEAESEQFARIQLKEYITSPELFKSFLRPLNLVEVSVQTENMSNSQVGTQVKPNMAGASGVPQGGNDGSGMAPQATSVTGTFGPPAQVLNTTGGANEVVVLNPQGPANLMSQGGVTFDLKNLIYDQFIDKDIEITVSDSIPIGTKLFEIPYDPLGEYMNDYIFAYMGLHTRFNGDIIIRVEVIGNPMFTGAICVGWTPEQIPGSVISAAAYQKYAYKVFSMQQSSVQEFVLKDARQYQYYRDITTFRKGADASRVPFLTGVCHVTIQNALKEGALVRIRIGSRLASQADLALGKLVTPFVFSNPTAVPNSVTPGSKSINGMTLTQIFPSMAAEYYRGFSDGTQYVPGYTQIDSSTGLAYHFSLKTSLPCLVGGQFPEDEFKRLIISNLETHVFGSDLLRVVALMTQFGPQIEATIAKSTSFTNLPNNKDTWLADAETANCITEANVTVYVKRNITVSLEVYKKDSYEVLLVQQTHFLTDHGVAIMWCFTANPPSNNINYVAPIGIRNSSTPTEMIFPHSPALGAIVVNQNTVSLPINWKNFVFTNNLPTTVVAQTEQAPSALSTYFILNYFKLLTEDYGPTECAEFDLVDPVSKDTVITLRYLPVSNSFVIKPMDTLNYAMYPGDISKLIVNRFTRLDTSAVFTQTDTTSWLSRAGTQLQLLPLKQNKTYNDYVVDQLRARSKKNKIIELFAVNKANAFVAALGEGLLGEGALAGASSELASSSMEAEVRETLLRHRMDALVNDWRLEGVSDRLNDLRSVPTVSNGTQTTLSETGTRIGRNATTQTGNNGMTRYTQTSGFTQPNNLGKTGGKLPGTNNSNAVINQTLNFGSSAGASATQRSFMADLALNCIPIMLMQSSQSNGNVAGTFENAGLEEMGITKEDYAYKHSMEMERQKEWFEQQQHEQSNQFTADQNALNRQQQEQMQKEQFANQEKMQQEQFDFTSKENEKNRAQKEQLQQEQFENQTKQSNLNYEHSRELQTQKFGEDMALTAVSGGLNLATHAMDDVAQIYNTKQQIKGQKQLTTQKANESMYVQGATAQSLQLASN